MANNEKNTSPEEKLVHSLRQSNSNFNLYEPEERLPDEYVDGIGQLGFGPAVSKVTFYSAVGQDTDPNYPNLSIERRLLTKRLVMPTPALVEFCQSTLASIYENSPVLLSHLESFKSLVKQNPPDVVTTAKGEEKK